MLRKLNLFVAGSLAILALFIGIAVVDQVGLKEQVGVAVVSAKTYTPATTRHQKFRGDSYQTRIPENWRVTVTLSTLSNGRSTVSVSESRYRALEPGTPCRVKYKVGRLFKAVHVSSID